MWGASIVALIVVPIVACWVAQCALRVCHEHVEEARTRECFGTGHSTHRYEGGGCGGRHAIRTATTVCGCRACGARCAEPICTAVRGRVATSGHGPEKDTDPSLRGYHPCQCSHQANVQRGA